MNYYLDTEFLEGKQSKRFLGIKYGETKPTIDLISIGIVAEDGRKYYAISKDFNLWEAWNRYDLKHNSTIADAIDGKLTEKVYWIRENVLKPIYYEMVGKDINFHDYDQMFTYSHFKKLLESKGKSRHEIQQEVLEFTNQYTDQYLDYSDTKPEMIDNNPRFYAYFADYDWVIFCWLFGNMINLPENYPMYCIDLKQIYDQTTYDASNDIEMWGKELKKHPDYPKQTNEHNALGDAEWNQKLHNFLNNIS